MRRWRREIRLAPHSCFLFEVLSRDTCWQLREKPRDHIYYHYWALVHASYFEERYFFGPWICFEPAMETHSSRSPLLPRSWFHALENQSPGARKNISTKCVQSIFNGRSCCIPQNLDALVGLVTHPYIDILR